MKFDFLQTNEFLSIPVSIKISGTTIKLMELYFTRYEYDIPPHVHSSHEGVLFIKGTGKYITYDNLDRGQISSIKTYSPGTILNVPPGMLHSYKCEGEHILIYWNWIIDQNTLNIPFNEFIMHDNEKEGLRELSANIYELSKSASADETHLHALISTFLLLTIKALFGFEGHNTNKKLLKSQSTQLSDRIITFIKDNFHQDLTLETLSEYFYKSPRQISRLLKMHNPPVSFTKELRRQRINAACQMLQNKPYEGLQIIAEKCGFDDVYYFSRVFKKEIGISPKRYAHKRDGSILKVLPLF